MRAIPLSLLPSTMVWREPSGDPDAMDGEYGPEEHAVGNVRFDEERPRPTGGYAGEYQRYDGPAGKVFIDAENSEGIAPPPVGALCRIDGGEEMAVRKVAEFRTVGGRVHHWEVEVA